MGKYRIDDNELGTLVICTRRGMRCVRSCVKNGIIEMHVPQGLSYVELCNIVEVNRNSLRQMLERNRTTGLHYHVGQKIDCLGGRTIIIGTQSLLPQKIILGGDMSAVLCVNVPETADFDDDNTTMLISRCLRNIAKRIAPVAVLSLAEIVADEIGVRPLRFVIGAGLRKLGHCTQRGEIQLSYNLVFLPEKLARFVILHELAHLSHFNHGTRFHALLDRYCDGRERELSIELKQFQWPVQL